MANTFCIPTSILSCSERVGKIAMVMLERGEDFGVFFVNSVRDIDALLPHEINLSGAYNTVKDVEAPHSFMFLPRSGLNDSN